MQIMSLSVPIAPQTTGHPFGLPENRDIVRRETRIEPIAGSRNPDAGFKDGKKPLQFWRSASGLVDPATHIPPPSIMQIKISQMLDEQASLIEPDPDAEKPSTDTEARGTPSEQKPAAEETEASEQPQRKDDPRKGYEQAVLITQTAASSGSQ